MDRTETAAPPAKLALKRTLGLWLLTAYGLGTIIGAGIYVLIGEVAAAAGLATPLAFLLAGVLAALTGLCYAELAARFPEAAGAAAYVAEGWGSAALSRFTGFMVLAVGVVLAASLARGAADYLAVFVALPQALAAAGFVALFTAVAALGVRDSVAVAAVLTGVELAGLALVIAVGGPALADLPARLAEMAPTTADAWLGLGGGAFLAFFAFIGFESLANMGAEAKDPERTLPRAILLALAVSTALYVLVASVVVLAVPLDRLAAGDTPPLMLVLAGAAWAGPPMAAIALIAVTNGILIDIVMSSRLLYGMAERGLLPSWLAALTPRSRIPLRATLVAGGATLAAAVALPFARLVSLTSLLTLAVFLLVNLSLWRLQRARPSPDLPLPAPRWAPPLAVALCLLLLASEAAGWLVSR